MIGYTKLRDIESLNQKKISNLVEMNEGNYGLFTSYESNDLKLIRAFGESSSRNNYILKSNLN